VLQQGYLLLQSGWVVSNSVLFANILTVCLSTLNVVKVVAIGVEHNLSRVIEEHAHRRIRQVVPKTVLG